VLNLGGAVVHDEAMSQPSSGSSGRPSVAIFGGGVGGLSVAQELLERGFSVTVYEKSHWGGKVRGMPVPGSGTQGREDLPGQHGFHFFPGFYKNLPDTMKRIPSLDGKTVFEHVVEGDAELLARQSEPSTKIPASFHFSLKWLLEALHAFRVLMYKIPPSEMAFFVGRALMFLGTCRDRRITEFDEVSWWDFVEAERMSPEYQNLIGRLPSLALIAVRPQDASSRTLGDAMIQMFSYGFFPGRTIDRLLDGPEQSYWVEPWVAHVQKLGGDLRMPAQLVSFQCDGRKITSALVEEGGAVHKVVADYYVCALPLNVAVYKLTPEIRRAAPSLARIGELASGWMNGVQLFLNRQLPLVRGHVGYGDSAWALTSVSQAQFWPDFDWSAYGNGQSREAFSVIISDWDTPGVVHHKPAKQCSPQEIYEEVLAQLNLSLASHGEAIRPDEVESWFIDPDIVFPRGNERQDENLESLFITTCGAWTSRPTAKTEIPNLVMASEWMQHCMDFASAEGTNQVAREAANAILDAAKSSAKRCPVYRTKQPLVSLPLRALDAVLYRCGLPALGSWGCTSYTPPPRVR
jgi:uncharacterized protein with NAD-binding domain and iron-sulfur cluster